MKFTLTRKIIPLLIAGSLNACGGTTDDSSPDNGTADNGTADNGTTDNSTTGDMQSVDAVVIDTAALDAVVLEELGNQSVVGGAVAVVRNGAIVHAKGYGHTGLDRVTPVTSETVFRWASISKTLTAVAALQLDEVPNNFSIEDKVNAHVADWPADTSIKSDVTVKQLLSNRAGIIHYQSTDICPGNPAPDFDGSLHGDIPFDAEKAVDVFEDQALCFTPGSDYKYSTFGFTLAAAALEAEANESYSQWVQNNVAVPLGMDSLTEATGTSTGFKLNCGELTSVTEGPKSYVLPGGGWESNISDLAKFANGLLQGTLLDDTERLWTEETGNSNTYRLGISFSSDGERAWHGGAHNDLRTFMHLYHGREDNVGVVVYLNNPDSNPERVAKAVANTLGVSSWSDLGAISTGSCDTD